MSSISTSDNSQQNSEDFTTAQYRYDEQGRRYHNRGDAAYVLPNDDEGNITVIMKGASTNKQKKELYIFIIHTLKAHIKIS